MLWSLLKALPRYGAALPELAFAWADARTAGATASLSAPLLTSAWNEAKWQFVSTILEWYRAHAGVDIATRHVYFFDDSAEVVQRFAGSGYNARQISCASEQMRVDGCDHCRCGGTEEELESMMPFVGVHLCRNITLCLERDGGELGPCQRPQQAGGVAIVVSVLLLIVGSVVVSLVYHRKGRKAAPAQEPATTTTIAAAAEDGGGIDMCLNDAALAAGQLERASPT